MDNITTELETAVSAGSKSGLKEVLAEFNAKIIASRSLPICCQSLIEAILSRSSFYNVVGIEEFFVILLSPPYLIREDIEESISRLIKENYIYYKNVEFCWVICDIIARQFDRDHAYELLHFLANLPSDPGQEGAALGLDILAQASQS